MNPQQQAYIEGFVKRASEYGFSEDESMDLLKQATRFEEELHKAYRGDKSELANFIKEMEYPDFTGKYSKGTFDSTGKKLPVYSMGDKDIPDDWWNRGFEKSRIQDHRRYLRERYKPTSSYILSGIGRDNAIINGEYSRPAEKIHDFSSFFSAGKKTPKNTRMSSGLINKLKGILGKGK